MCSTGVPERLYRNKRVGTDPTRICPIALSSRASARLSTLSGRDGAACAWPSPGILLVALSKRVLARPRGGSRPTHTRLTVRCRPTAYRVGVPNDGVPAARRELPAPAAPLGAVRAPRDPIIGQCPGLRRVLAAADKIAPTTMSVLVAGETGTGKEGLARRLHDASKRTGPFVVVNCASLPPELVESELFGHERGAFTGAVAPRKGLVLEASCGTLFLDEVGELAPAARAGRSA